MTPATAARLTFAYDAPAQRLLSAWQGATAPDATLQAHYAELLAAAQANGHCRFWLLDMRQRDWHSLAFSRWFGHEFAAAVRAALGQPVFLAYVLTPAQHQASAESPEAQATQRACAAHNVYPFFFDTMPAALAWLEHQQALDAT